MMKSLKTFLILIFITFFMGATVACQNKSTINGVAFETKGGLIVEGVVIPDEKIPAGVSPGVFAGKRVQVTGRVVTTEDEKPEGGIQVQRREGPYQYFKSVESIRIVGSK